MVNILLSGCNGKMGKTVSELCKKMNDTVVTVGVDKFNDGLSDYPVFSNFDEVDLDFDVILDFSTASNLENLLRFAKRTNKPVVICTTGFNDEQKAAIQAASSSIPVFFSYNMSLGISLLTELAVKASKILGDCFDIEIVEKHHNQKIDAPSGTAYKIADAINEANDDNFVYEFDRHSKREKRSVNEIGIHSVRGGTIVGEHDVIFAGEDEVITISHSAYSKRIFAVGALNAVRFLSDRSNGMYTMKDIIEL